MEAQTAAARAKHARAGLAVRGALDRTTHAMLLRQLYMAHYERKWFRKAYETAVQALALRVMVDVVHQDAARACSALGLHEEAIGHLRLAARRGPPSRRAFHLWTLGSTLMLAGRHAEAAAALDRASRWGTTDRPLYVAHAHLARLLGGLPATGVRAAFDRLERAPCGQGYGRFVLGMLAFQLHRWDDSRELLGAFLERTAAGRPAMAFALAGEISLASALLGSMRVVN